MMHHTLNTLLDLSKASTFSDENADFSTYVPVSKMYEKSLLNAGKQTTDATFQYRSRRIQKSQYEYSQLFSKLDVIIGQLKDKYPPYAEQPEVRHMEEDMVSEGTEPSSGASTSSETRTASSGTHSVSRKRRICLEDDYIEIDEYEPIVPLLPLPKNYKQTPPLQSKYPMRLNCHPGVVIIGPNGTQISAEKFDMIDWHSTAPAATRSLLAVVFSSEVLATHTLTGKPSPAFYGRERPSKLQLDSAKVSDIITCVRSMCEGSGEREIRAAITTKCADTAKKFKRRSAKLNSGA